MTGGELEPRAGGLAFLILVGDQRSGDRAGWRRGRRVLLDVDKKIATTPGVDYRVRALQSGPGTARSELLPAGRLSRRHLRWSESGPDLARGLGLVQAIMTRDLAALERSALLVARPAIVVFAVEPPLADAITAGEHGDLAREAPVTWVVPESSAGLMSPAFAADGARILTDHLAVTDEVVHLLRTSTAGAPPLPRS